MSRDLLASLGTAAALLALVVTPFVIYTQVEGVGFANPWGLALGLLALPILLLYVLKTRRPRRTVGSILFWRPIAVDQQATSPFKRLRRNLVLLLLLLALAALSYGLARPVVQGDSREGLSLVIVIDVSASMLAEDHEEQARFEAARAEAYELVANMGTRDQATIIACDQSAWLVVPWTQDDAELYAGIERLEPRHTGTALADGMILAASSAREASGHVEVHLFSDGGGPGVPPVDLQGPLVYHRFGQLSDNVGIVAVDLRPREGSGGDVEAKNLSYEVFASVRNAGKRTRTVFVGLQREGRTLAARKVKLAPNSDQPVVLEARLAPGPVRVRVLPLSADEALDPFPVDDSAWALVPKEGGVAVVLVTRRSSPALERALLAAGASLRVVEPAGLGGFDPELRLFVFEDVLPETLPPRDCLLINPALPVGPITPGPPTEVPRVAWWDREDPLLQYVNLEVLDQDLARARPLELSLKGGARVLLQGEDADKKPVVLMATWQEGSAKRTALGFDPYDSSWTLKPSFPIFIRNCLEVASQRDHLARKGLVSGTPVAIPVGLGETSVRVVSPNGEERVIPAPAGHALFGDAVWSGVYTVHAGERQERFCVNLGSPEESRIGSKQTFEVEGVEARERQDLKRPYEVASWFALVALVVLSVELWAYHRRW